MFKILTEGRRAKNTLRGINVGTYLSSDKVALQIKMTPLAVVVGAAGVSDFSDGMNRRLSQK